MCTQTHTHTHIKNMLCLDFKFPFLLLHLMQIATTATAAATIAGRLVQIPSSSTHTHIHTHTRERKSSQMFYSLLNLSVIAVRVASTQQSPGLLQGLLNGFSSSSHSAARTETLNTSLHPINNEHTLPLWDPTHKS